MQNDPEKFVSIHVYYFIENILSMHFRKEKNPIHLARRAGKVLLLPLFSALVIIVKTPSSCIE